MIWEEGTQLESKLQHKLAAAEGGLNISGFPPELATSSPGSSLIHEMAGFDVLAQQQVDNEILKLNPRVSPYHWESYTSPEEFSTLSIDIKHRLQEAIQEHEDELRSHVAKKQWGLGTEIGAFIVNGVLGLASLAIPWLAIPAAAIGLGAGLGSVRDIIRRVQGLRRFRSESEARPIGILWDAYSRDKR